MCKKDFDDIKEFCYSLYKQGVMYKDIAEVLNLPKRNVEYYVKSWACVNFLPFPVYKGKGYFCYQLYRNNMGVKDIARLLGRKEITIYKNIYTFCALYNVPSPFKRKGELAYRLKEEKGLSYREIAEIVGYHNKSNCFRAIKSYKKKLNS